MIELGLFEKPWFTPSTITAIKLTGLGF